MSFYLIFILLSFDFALAQGSDQDLNWTTARPQGGVSAIHTPAAWMPITVTSSWARWSLKSPALGLFTQPFIQVQINENIKAPRYWPLWGEFTGHRWIPRTKGQ